MPLPAALQKNWNDYAAKRPFARTLAIDDKGIALGKTLLARFENGSLVLDPSRIRTMLSVTYGREISDAVVDNFRYAERCWKRGDVTLAQMHLALTGLHAIDREQAQRLFVADWAMSRGVSSQQLLKFAGVLRKDDSDDDDDDSEDDSDDESGDDSGGNSHYDPSEPRIPSGQPNAGEWTIGDGRVVSPHSASQETTMAAAVLTKDECINICSELLPTQDFGASFDKCMAECTGK